MWEVTQKICECTLRTSYGFPCDCELEKYTLDGDSIAIDVVHINWRKLRMEGKRSLKIYKWLTQIMDMR